MNKSNEQSVDMTTTETLSLAQQNGEKEKNAVNKVVIDAVIFLDEVVLEKFNTLIDAQVLAEQDNHMEHMIL